MNGPLPPGAGLCRPIESDNPWLWSDLHLWHACLRWEEPLWKKRGFTSPVDHALSLEKRWCEKVREDEDVVLLGDSAFGSYAGERLPNILGRLPFRRLFIMPGNHIGGFKHMADHPDSVPPNVYLLPNYAEMNTNHGFLVLSHYPILSWNNKAKGAIMVHGHCHGNLLDAYPEYYNGRVFDVSVEVEPYPVRASELARRKQFQPEPKKYEINERDRSTEGSEDRPGDSGALRV